MPLESVNGRNGARDIRLDHKQNGPSDAPGAWSSILAGLCQLTHATIALVATVDPSRQRVSLHGSVNIADQYLQSYATHHDILGPFTRRVVGATDLGVIWTATDGEAGNTDGTDGFFAGWLRPQGVAHVICGLLAIREPQATYLTIGRAREAGAYDSGDIELFASLLPCIL